MASANSVVVSLLLLGVLAAVAVGLPTTNSSVILGKEGRIIGGGTPYYKHINYAVRLAIEFKINGANKVGYCSGSLITLRTVLTAAHCFRMNGVKTHKVFAVVGCTSIGSQCQQKKAYPVSSSNVKVPSQWQTGEYRNGYDIGLVVLNQAFNTDGGKVATIPIASLGSHSGGLAVVGWGKDGSGPLKWAWTFKQNCIGWADSKVLCTKKHDGKACHGDSGGPVVKHLGGTSYQLVAVHTYSEGPVCSDNMLNIMTEPHSNWINNNKKW